MHVIGLLKLSSGTVYSEKLSVGLKFFHTKITFLFCFSMNFLKYPHTYVIVYPAFFQKAQLFPYSFFPLVLRPG